MSWTLARAWLAPLVLLAVAASYPVLAQQPPAAAPAPKTLGILGIPEPEFGIVETAPAEPASWFDGAPSEVPGFYYVCGSCEGSSDDNNSYGHPGHPRQSIPNALEAGSYVRLAGDYDVNHGSPRRIQAAGTLESPVWIRGTPDSVPNVTRTWEVRSSSYLIIEYLHFTDRNGSMAGEVFIGQDGADHIVVRNNEFTGNRARTGGLLIFGGASHIVAYQNRLHDLGNINDTGDQDKHCILLGASEQVWIVDNELAYCSGDGIQINAGANKNALLHHAYVGRNHMHHNKQAGLGLKNGSDIIVSQNTVHDHRTSSSSPGACLSQQYGGQRAWFIFNTIYECDWAVQVASTSGFGDGTDVYVVGNVMYSIANACANFYPDSVRTKHLINNTCVNAQNGFRNDGNVEGTLDMQNNIFADIRGEQILVEGTRTASDPGTLAHHNLFSDGVRVEWGGVNHRGLSSWGTGEPSIEEDPDFVSVGANDYTLQSRSPAIDRGIGNGGLVYTTFEELYGRSIAFDRNGVARPQGTSWDMGAYEWPAPVRQDAGPSGLRR